MTLNTIHRIAIICSELENAGIPCEPVRLDAYTGKPMTFFRDPDGLPIEIHE
jgi:glyoxylase I family protein